MWCPGNYCKGQFAIRILNLNTNTVIASYATTNVIYETSWSPDSKYIAFDQVNKWQPDELSDSISLFDVTNLENKKIGRGYLPAFAHNDKNRMIAYIRNEDGSSSCCQIINLPSGTIEEFSFDRGLTYIDLSPDGNKLVAMSEEQNLFCPNIIDLRTKQITQLDAPFDNRHLWATKWSPNGKFFAVVEEAFLFQLTILNTMGDTQLKIEDDVHSWAWAENSDEIIFIKRNRANGCNAIDPYIYFATISSGEIFKMDFPLPIKNRLTNKNIHDCHNDLFGEITW